MKPKNLYLLYLLVISSLIFKNALAQCTIDITNIAITTPIQCSGDCNGRLAISLTGNQGAVTYVWTNSTGGTVGGNSSTAMNLCEGTYTCTVTDTANCTADTSITISAITTIQAGFVTDVSGGLAPVTVNFTITSIGATSQSWNFGDFSGNIIGIDTSHTYTSSGSYEVMLMASNGNCRDTAFATLIITGTPQLEAVNVFTPNGDGINDIFRPLTSDLSATNGYIYNRWGELIYSWFGQNGYWDGRTANGAQEAPTGTYYYVVIATGTDGAPMEITGHFKLIR